MILSLSVIISGCASQPETIVQTKYIKRDIPLQNKPKSINMKDIQFYVVTEDNIDVFLENLKLNEGEVVFFAISVGDYERLAFNMSELKRYIEQQKSLIIYYEENIKEEPLKKDEQQTIKQPSFFEKIKQKIKGI